MVKRTPTTKTLLSLTPEQIGKMSQKELTKVISTLASTANKRFKRLGETESGRMSPAYISAASRSYETEDGGKFGVKNKTLNQLRNEFKAVKTFLETKTGSVTKWKEYRQNIYNRLGGDFHGNAKAESDFWKIYRTIEKDENIIGHLKYGSTEIQTDLRRVIGERNAESIMREINDYNVSKKRKNRDKYIDKLIDQGYILNENHRRIKIDINDRDGIVNLMKERIKVAYEREVAENNEINEAIGRTFGNPLR